MKTYKLIIEPAIVPEERHKIEDVLKEMGYIVWGGGTYTDMSQCDITFDKDDAYYCNITFDKDDAYYKGVKEEDQGMAVSQ